MKKIDKKVCCSDPTILRMEEIKTDKNTISTRSTWLLGIIVLIVLALASFLANDAGSEVDGLAWVIRVNARTLCLAYSLIFLVYISLLIIPDFGNPIYEEYDEEELQECKKQNLENLEKLHRHFKTLVFLFIFFSSASLLTLISAWYII